MPASLDRFILSIPRLFLKQYPYAWFPAIVMWNRPPILSGLFLAIIAAAMLLLHWQSSAWMAHMRRELAGREGKFYVDRPAVPWGMSMRNIALMTAICGLVAYSLRGQFGLSFWQLLSLFAGFTLTYQDFRIFGIPTVYIITAAGIAVYSAAGLLDFRLFLTFKEISRIERTRFQKDRGWDCFARTRQAGADGLLLTSKDPNGFSKRLKRVFIVPRDIEKFIEQLPYGFGKETSP